ncbi:virB8 family protein [Oligella urethralis]|uniref:virB8 family protein n=1 Tax=Oligella urethralis TaxID=90245 RepID=UPI002431BFC7|nr:type IV secretion system protein [Oligella urethralis]
MRKENKNTQKEMSNMAIKQKGQKFIQEAKEFERTRIDSIKRSNKIAWRITAAAVAISVMSVGAVMMLSPLKTVEPFLLRVDNNTGAVDMVTMLKESETSYGEVTDKYWLGQYIKHREGYDWWTVQSNYDASMLLSGPNEQKIIGDFFASPAAPYKVFKELYRVDIKILSISWVGDVAQVRFEKKVVSLNESQATPAQPQRLIATIGYQYLNSPQQQADRLINPLGFQVMSYRVDPEG